jgi:hypothetical protein
MMFIREVENGRHSIRRKPAILLHLHVNSGTIVVHLVPCFLFLFLFFFSSFRQKLA